MFTYIFYGGTILSTLICIALFSPIIISGDDIKLHQCVAAYMSDISLLGTALQPGGPNYEITFMTSLDHSIWFHNPFQANEWMLYESFSPQGGQY